MTNLLYTNDLPITAVTTTETFAGVTAIVVSHENPLTASYNLQQHLNLLEIWLNKRKIKVNESKS